MTAGKHYLGDCRARPIPEPEADWQPGIIAGSEDQRPLLDCDRIIRAKSRCRC
jgi:hypothetical protein